MSFTVPPPPRPARSKLGLSLAGGGFRASLFHVGVLRRLAEMDMLRYVEVLSTVSGGSIVGALYILMLKQRLDGSPNLDRNDYVELATNLQAAFVAGIQKNLRTRLLMNPFGMLSVLLSHDGLGRRMGRIYQRYLYRHAVDALNLGLQGRLSHLLWPGWMPLSRLRFLQRMPQGIEAYNAQAAQQRASAIPNFIMNATSLNSGAPFRLSSNEIGDPRLGYFRYDEIRLLLARKELLALVPARLADLVARGEIFTSSCGTSLSARLAALAQWWIANDNGPSGPPPVGWTFFNDPAFKLVAESMAKTNFGRLRQLKLAAWYLREGLNREITGGLEPSQHRKRFNSVLTVVEPALDPKVLDAISNPDNQFGNELLEFAIELYYLRSAVAMSPRLQKDFSHRISLGTAVAASANFPPVFPPLVLLGIYDDVHVSRLGLTDGGVYDNLGVTTLVDEGCTHIIASDTGAPFEVKQRVSPGYTGMLTRLPDVLMDDVAGQQRTRQRDRARLYQDLSRLPNHPGVDALKEAYGLDGLALFSIDSLNPPGGGGINLPGSDSQKVACLRTDLDAFGDIEVAALINTGYDHADRFLKAGLANSPYYNNYWSSQAVPPCKPTARYERYISDVLEVGTSRVFRSLKLSLRGLSLGLSCFPSWLFVIAALAAVYLWGRRPLSICDLINGIPGAIIGWLENPFPLFTWLEGQHPSRGAFARLGHAVDSLLKRQLPLWALVFCLGLLLLLIFKGWPWLAGKFRKAHRGRGRQIAFLLKWLRAFAPALFLLAALTPLWIALAAFALALVSHCCFNWPYLRATRME